MRAAAILLAVFLIAVPVTAANMEKPEIRGEEVTYKADSITMRGYLAYDAGLKGKRPGILVVHEWWGNNDYSRMRARMLAELGYIALAVDMYGDGKTVDNPQDAGKCASAVMQNIDEAEKKFLAAMEVLKSNPMTDTSRIGAIGYCFGGGVVLNMARLGVDMQGVVSFHGSLSAARPAKPGMIRPALLVCNGAADPFAPADAVKAFKNEMDGAGVHYTFKDYPDAKHAFTNPNATAYGKKFNLPLAYNKAADKASWADMKMFFTKIFGK